MRPLLRVALVVGLLLTTAVPARADHGDIHPTVRAETAYFHCAGDVKAQNLSVIQGVIPSWDTTAPAESVQQGAGCGFYDNLVGHIQGIRVAAAVWEGTFTGNLDTLTVEAHRLLPVAGATLPNRVQVDLLVDGEARLTNVPATVVHTASSTGASTMTKISVSGLGYLTEDGDGEQSRTVRVVLSSANETQSIWVFDTTEVPAGITFNPATLAGTVLEAQ